MFRSLRDIKCSPARFAGIGGSFNPGEGGGQEVKVLLRQPLKLLKEISSDFILSLWPRLQCQKLKWVKYLNVSTAMTGKNTCHELQCSMVILVKVLLASLLLLLLGLLFFTRGSELLLSPAATCANYFVQCVASSDF